jgi:predicted PurR-regulated permease PerM
MARYISFAVLLAIIVFIGALFYKVMIGFFVPVFLAVVLVVVFRPLHRWVCSKVGDREHIAAGVTTALILLIVLIPAAIVLSMATVQGASLLRDFKSTSIKLSLARLRSNSLLNLEFPYASQVQDIQQKIDDIQLQVSKDQNYSELMAANGRMQGDVGEIRLVLKELIPQLLKSTQEDALRRIDKLRLKNQSLQPTDEKTRFAVAKYFQQTEKDLVALIEVQAGDSIEKLQEELDRVLNHIDLPLEDLSLESQVILDEVRRKVIAEGLVWSKAIAETSERLDALTPGVDAAERNVAQLQRAAVELGSQWLRTRETISGGPWLGALKDLANPSDADIENIYKSFFEYIRPRLVSFTGDSAVFLLRFIISSSILLLSLYFFLYDGPGMIRTLMELSPLDDRYELELLAQFDRISRAIVLATVLSALLQGLVAGIGYYFAGMPSLILLIALTSTCALIPFVGPAIVWVPVCVFLAVYEENLVAAGLLALWGMLVVGTVDNLVKVLVLHGQSRLHPLLALLSVLGGIQSLGPIGILVGPMVVVLLQTLLGILRTELTNFRKSDETALGNGTSTHDPSSLSGLIRKVKGSISTGDAAESIAPSPSDTPQVSMSPGPTPI